MWVSVFRFSDEFVWFLCFSSPTDKRNRLEMRRSSDASSTTPLSNINEPRQKCLCCVRQIFRLDDFREGNPSQNSFGIDTSPEEPLQTLYLIEKPSIHSFSENSNSCGKSAFYLFDATTKNQHNFYIKSARLGVVESHENCIQHMMTAMIVIDDDVGRPEIITGSLTVSSQHPYDNSMAMEECSIQKNKLIKHPATHRSELQCSHAR